jgi:hypothetical protein
MQNDFLCVFASLRLCDKGNAGTADQGKTDLAGNLCVTQINELISQWQGLGIFVDFPPLVALPRGVSTRQ